MMKWASIYLKNGLKNIVIFLFILFHITAVLYWNFYWDRTSKKEPDSKSYNFFKYYMEPLGIWQKFSVFAPPPKYEGYVLIEARAGNLTLKYSPDYQIKPTRINHENERKLHENLLNEHSRFIIPYLNYWCNKFEKMYNAGIEEVNFYTYSKEIPVIRQKREELKPVLDKKASLVC